MIKSAKKYFQSSSLQFVMFCLMCVTIHRLDRQPKRNAQHKTGRCLSADLKDSCLVWSGSHDFLDLLENILILHGRGPDYCLKCEVVIS